MKIAVLYGGVSGEREVSLSSGKGIIAALEKNGHEVIGIDFNPNQLQDIIQLDVDLVFIGLHGKYGEDGRIQGLLDMLGIPYVGSGVLASALAMDKAKAKQIFNMNHIPQAKSEVYRLSKSNQVEQIGNEIKTAFTPPFVIKPNKEGSTLGLTIVTDTSQIEEALTNAQASDDAILVEEFIAGRELTVAVMGAGGNEFALPIIEIIPKNAFYDYESKYAPGGSEHIVPAIIDEATAEQIKTYAVLAHQSLGCETYSRVDFILNKENVPMILEVNTLPGMTPTSLFPDAAKSIGIEYHEMIEKFVELTMHSRQV
ncbi:D-alanine--D-alanine ligase [Oceanobacillus profundus]|uniref:D-alanine--D-alanine ligase n=1 Tax=Oceanobacillus profundus TaxID=372463 RepID=A0A417YFR1_9BACI|nr:D-alanine--D-alanine ligase [Oceanobacillus profundus]MBR3120757.1 D-alanine--D-alanine ligase [Oceanobacillus sp.]PAE29836.1 D-alanine--D-alanine ligase [Paenibacillus sp. 7884-2]MCM3396603.1 D-alanine--D-alanine ligase [Oceanobacillus profundus]MDO6450697.1 D-alanine--D-alanine ligase [Oceanobacillus profundus]RHW31560.1 D-alanine--D-alanine ligase [Oceanobacillus profundus]